MSSTGMVRVSYGFNPEGSQEVEQMKGVSATLIDNLQTRVDMGGERGRLARIAQDKFEEACMFAVKAITANQ